VQLLTLYRLDERLIGVNQDETIVAYVLAEQMARNESLFRHRQIEVNLSCDDDLVWFLDSELIGSILNNLLGNAVRYARHQISIKALQDEGYLSILIEDDGEGFPDDFLSNTNEVPTLNSLSGTQLGLFFAKRILSLHQVKDHKGELRLSNKTLGSGARVELRIP
jgi:signal transduction histidine kinase